MPFWHKHVNKYSYSRYLIIDMWNTIELLFRCSISISRFRCYKNLLLIIKFSFAFFIRCTLLILDLSYICKTYFKCTFNKTYEFIWTYLLVQKILTCNSFSVHSNICKTYFKYTLIKTYECIAKLICLYRESSISTVSISTDF